VLPFGRPDPGLAPPALVFATNSLGILGGFDYSGFRLIVLI
jgi:hypothetical protein